MDPGRDVLIRVKRLRSSADDLPLPRYETSGAAGMDLRADLDQPIKLLPGERGFVPTGFAIELPQGYEAQVRPRSGLALRHGVTLLNAPGTIDSDYRGEVSVLLVNLGSEECVVRRGDRVAQLVIAPVAKGIWSEVDDLHSTERGAGGFGHTGR